MKDAYAKCSAPPPPPPFDDSSNSLPSILLGKLPPGFSIDPSTQTITKPTDGAIHNQENELPTSPQHKPPVLAFRPQGVNKKIIYIHVIKNKEKVNILQL